jgi:hypothetical protein
MRKISRIQDEPTIFMKGQQLRLHSDTLTDFQVTQNKQLTRVWGGHSAKQKKILKMKDEPTICMKTQGHVTQCHSQLCDFEGGCDTGLGCLPAPSRFAAPDQHSTALSALSFDLCSSFELVWVGARRPLSTCNLDKAFRIAFPFQPV